MTTAYKGPQALSNAHVLAAIVRTYGFDQILLPKVNKLTRSIESIINNVTFEFRSSDPELRHVRIFANDEGIYLAPGWKYCVPLEKATLEFLIEVLNSPRLYKKARP
jgi:hypothetical protein